MCGRYSLNTTHQTLRDHFGELIVDNGGHAGSIPGPMLQRYNIAPSQTSPIIRIRAGEYRNDPMVWGFRPGWAKRSWINARAETVFRNPPFKGSAGGRRCLIPATGWYEWKGDTTPRHPYHLCLKNRRPLAFAGVWTARQTDTGWELSYAIITTEPDAVSRTIHSRMPAVMHPSNYRDWLDPKTSSSAARLMLGPFQNGDLTAYEIGTYVNKPENEGPQCLQRVST